MSTTVAQQPRTTTPSHRPAVAHWAVVGVLALLPVLAFWPFRAVPLTSDEAGFLLLAHQWHPGTSLYGNYWVDRPPLLLWIFEALRHAGPIRDTAQGQTAVAFRLAGGLVGGLAVVLAAALAQILLPHRRAAVGLLVPATASLLLLDPLLGMPEVNGELLAIPFVLLGVLLLVRAARRPAADRTTLLLAALAGVAGTAAALVKQNEVDVALLAVATLVLGAARHTIAGAWRRLAALATGAVATLALALAGAAVNGTSPTGLFDAVVLFRLRASAVINAGAAETNTVRFGRLLESSWISGLVPLVLGAAALILASAWRARRRAPLDPVLVGALAMAAWELFGVLAGGSYWLHYLTSVVPGAVLLLALALARPARVRDVVLTALVGWIAIAGTVTWVQRVVAPHPDNADDAPVITYLRENARPGDGVVVAFGHPDIVAGTGLSSPYEHLWSLPVRVRDPRLADFEAVITGPQAPEWVVVAGTELATWGVDAEAAQRALDARYRETVELGDWTLWRRVGADAGPRP